MRKIMQEFINDMSGRTVFVIGGGPSINQQDLSLLKNKKIVCINTAYKIFPDAMCLYWADTSWIENNIDSVKLHKAKYKFHSKFHLSSQYLSNENACGIGGSILLRRTGDTGIDPNIDHVRGNNSGAHVLNLLHNAKVRKIVLLGYDMKITDSKSHWHQETKLPIRPDTYCNLFIPSIMSMAQQLKSSGIEVINTSMKSELKCFKKMKLEECV